MKPNWRLVLSTGSKCPACGEPVTYLMKDASRRLSRPGLTFFICWQCKQVYQAGKEGALIYDQPYPDPTKPRTTLLKKTQDALILFLNQYWIPGDEAREARPEIRAGLEALEAAGLTSKLAKGRK